MLHVKNECLPPKEPGIEFLDYNNIWCAKMCNACFCGFFLLFQFFSPIVYNDAKHKIKFRNKEILQSWSRQNADTSPLKTDSGCLYKLNTYHNKKGCSIIEQPFSIEIHGLPSWTNVFIGFIYHYSHVRRSRNRARLNDEILDFDGFAIRIVLIFTWWVNPAGTL